MLFHAASITSIADFHRTFNPHSIPYALMFWRKQAVIEESLLTFSSSTGEVSGALTKQLHAF